MTIQSLTLAFGALLATSAGLAMQRVEVGSAEACESFLSSFSEGQDNITLTMMGQEGGYWSPCTHLKTYGLNFAPFFARFLSYQLAPQTALEFGCGLGTTSDFIARQANAEVTCIEPEKTLGTLIASLRRDNLGKGKLSQLALNIFDEDSASRTCVRAVAEGSHDLVFSLEVAEHIPHKFHPALVDFLVKSTSKWLVFSAARPDQVGTGHIPESSLFKEQWQEIFAERGLIHMPKLSAMARRAAYPLRSYDLFFNVLVFKHPSNTAEDTDQPHEMLRDFMYGGMDNERDAIWFPDLDNRESAARGFSEGSNAAMWPSLTLMEQQTKKGLRCASQSMIGLGRRSVDGGFETDAMTSAWGSFFYKHA